MGILQGEYKLHQSSRRQQGGIRKKNTAKQQHPVKLSIITQYYPPDYAPTGQLIEELATQLRHQGLDIHIFTGQPGYAYKKETAPTIERKDRLLIRRSRTARLWPQRIRGKAVNGLLFCLRSALHLLKTCWRGDVLLLTTAPPFLPVLGYLANLFFGLPYVCLLYDLYPDVAVELQVVPVRHWLVKFWNLINREVWKNAKGIVVLSPSMKERIVAKCPEVADKVTVIHSWANPNIVPLPKHDNWFAHKYNLVDKFTVLYSGNMGRCHDMETIMEAARFLRNEPIQFVFIGDGAKRQACEEQMATFGLNNCLFLPYQDKQCLPYSLTACDLSLVSVSSRMEGTVAPSKLYGILAAGRPVAVICEERSYLRRLVEKEAECGATFRNGDATGLAEFIRRLASDKQLAHQMGKAGRRYLQSNFTLEIIAKQYSQVLCEALVTDVHPQSCPIIIEQAH